MIKKELETHDIFSIAARQVAFMHDAPSKLKSIRHLYFSIFLYEQFFIPNFGLPCHSFSEANLEKPHKITQGG